MTTSAIPDVTSTSIPDIALRKSSDEFSFVCSSNIVYAYIDGGESKIVFDKIGLVSSNATMQNLESLLFNKGFINLGNRILFNFKKLQKVLEEDFVHYLIMSNGSRIKITSLEVDSLKSYLLEF